MNEAMRVTLIWSLTLALATILTANSANLATAQEEVEGGEEVESREENVGKVSKKPAIPEQIKVPSSLFPTLGVAVDSCYVFFKPSKKSNFFGPLVKGEKIRRLDAYKKWVRVWIPRLLVSGWVIGANVRATGKTNASQGGIPENLITILTVIGKRANIRKGPSTRSSIIFQAKQGEEFWLLNKKKGWYQIGIPRLKKKGWVHGKLIGRKKKNRKR